MMNRRDFLKQTLGAVGAMSLAGLPKISFPGSAEDPLFEISLAQWSLHKTLAKG